jgi:hypothetical protein
MFEAVAKYLNVDEAEVIDNCDGSTVTVFDTIYLVIDLIHGITEYKYAIIPLN